MQDHPIVKSVHGRLEATGLPQPIPDEREEVEAPLKDAKKQAEVVLGQPKATPISIGKKGDTIGAIAEMLPGNRLDTATLRKLWGTEYEVKVRKAAEQFARKGAMPTVEAMLMSTGVDTELLVFVTRLADGPKKKAGRKAETSGLSRAGLVKSTEKEAE